MENTKTLFFVPGLGCDQRIFKHLIPLLKQPDLEVQHLEFIEPLNSNEPIVSYAQRVKESLSDPDTPCVIIGMSLGGMISVELAKILNCQQLILLSTIKHNSELPWYFKPLRVLPIYKLVPNWFTRKIVPRLAKLLGLFINREDSSAYYQMLNDRTDAHLKWARGAAINWNNQEYPKNCIHIHGTKDHIFKHKKVNPDYSIRGGTHNMVMNKPQELADIINNKMGWEE